MSSTLLPLLAMPNLSWATIQDELDRKYHASQTQLVSEILSLYRQETGSADKKLHVVNIQCGTGKYLREFAKRNHRVSGMDTDYQNLEAAVGKQVKEGSASRLYHSQDQTFTDIRDANIIVGFAHAFSELAHNTLGAKMFLTALRSMLCANGLILLETSFFPEPRRQQIVLNNELSATVQIDVNEYAYDSELIDEVTTLSLIHDGESLTTRRNRKIRRWVPSILSSLLADSGFSAVQHYSLAERTFVTGQKMVL